MKLAGCNCQFIPRHLYVGIDVYIGLPLDKFHRCGRLTNVQATLLDFIKAILKSSFHRRAIMGNFIPDPSYEAGKAMMESSGDLVEVSKLFYSTSLFVRIYNEGKKRTRIFVSVILLNLWENTLIFMLRYNKLVDSYVVTWRIFVTTDKRDWYISITLQNWIIQWKQLTSYSGWYTSPAFLPISLLNFEK